MNKAINNCDCNELTAITKVSDNLSVSMCELCWKIYSVEWHWIKLEQEKYFIKD